ncbi:nicotinic acid mononucleotide adenylyltransferase [Rhodobacter veldkampii DSM 11550]|uniref:Probable nicotinate-nucleotide adenylyltransferase n=1 Tax=Phaeovulum veldkampii DSM 11550 TaxID=1185920 RepID=A0A2T4JMK2_9RHOB|nr:nicotinate-nucleotide adenylyltransferase [Phaeovulum veldkampii]MBK5945339.1 nicotinic acid mononucleotide adenylyltransferase [Phaeovulum veldkampii DSM 11550]PTE19083.1 nicotinic acid mononucleotide adenylyltransferase [Phaeovulum veldkampii DSM 11550]TDQ61363.1 nicotinate-nucleotide adenylyltransferase [Phaeovulum veldkampii DSM 11550]
MRQGFPIAAPGMAIGLLGGSFDPAHSGHVHITEEALRRFGLDRVWWLVSPGNPLKPNSPAPIARRVAAARAIMQHPKVVVTAIEARLGTRYTAQTLARLKALYPGVRFVWLMGADNLVQFHRWDNWRQILAMVPVGVLARPGARMPARRSKVAQTYAGARLPGEAAQLLPGMTPPAWCFVDVPMVNLSSSAIRARVQRRGPLRSKA